MIRCCVRLQDGKIMPAQNCCNTGTGASARVCVNSVMGFASSAETEDGIIRVILEKAEANARVLSAHVNAVSKEILANSCAVKPYVAFDGITVK